MRFEPRRLLLLGGTGEAAALADALADERRLAVVTSLAGRTRAPRLPSGALRRGHFGGIDGLTTTLRDAAIDLVVDAAHPFAVRIGAHAREACDRLAIPYLRLLRPPWIPGPGDRWHEVADMDEAAAMLPRLGGRVLVTVGHAGLASLAACAGLGLIVRSIEPPTDLPFRYEWIGARGPFALADELDLLERRAIDVVLTKASGGDATRAKLDAARMRGLPVVMLRRPPPPPGPVVTTPEAAMAWLDHFLPEMPPVGRARRYEGEDAP